MNKDNYIKSEPCLKQKEYFLLKELPDGKFSVTTSNVTSDKKGNLYIYNRCMINIKDKLEPEKYSVLVEKKGNQYDVYAKAGTLFEVEEDSHFFYKDLNFKKILLPCYSIVRDLYYEKELPKKTLFQKIFGRKQ